MERRLAAIVAADMVGFSRQMQSDETGTLEKLKRIMAEIVESAISKNRGRIFKTMGDGFLAEFASAIDALNAAIEIQSSISDENENLAPLQQCSFRIGINIGDIIVDENGDVFGDGVNIAARLEPLASSGGIVVSDALRSQLWNKVGVDFQPLGRQQLKNIIEGIDVFLVVDKESTAIIPNMEDAVDQESKDRPVLAILPFDNMSADPDQEYLGAGITEDLIASLANVEQISVVSRNSAFALKDRAVSASDIRQELGAEYFVTGSLRRSGNRIRVTAQLTNAASDTQIWSARYDRELEDLFEVQDEITLTIATELQVELTDGEQAKLRYTTTDNIPAWMAFTRGISHFRNVNAESYRLARQNFETALEADPASAQIHAMLACTHAIEGRFFWCGDQDTSLQLAKELAEKALSIDSENADAWGALGYRHMCRNESDQSVQAYKRAVELAPGHADLHALYALALTFAEQPEEAIQQMMVAMRLNPLDPGWYCGVLGHAYRYAGKYDEALNILQDYNRQNSGFGLVDIVLTYADMGDKKAAASYAKKLIEARPEFSVAAWEKTQNCLDSRRLEKDRQALLESNLPA